MVQDKTRLEAYQTRREALGKLTDEQLKNRFWELCNQAVAPMVELAKNHTTPAIERSVLLRMGIDSSTAKAVVEKIFTAGLLGKGAGQVVLKVAQKRNLEVPAAGQCIVEEKGILDGLF